MPDDATPSLFESLGVTSITTHSLRTTLYFFRLNRHDHLHLTLRQEHRYINVVGFHVQGWPGGTSDVQAN
jgi:hypothetical protein